ncbi:MAG: hypothetical protein EOM45_10335 [Clostridia bacterium]|nr:hypothetical protein [Clostridia bacterium]
MKNLWSTTKVPVSVLKDAETIKAHEQTIKDLERTIKILKEENSYLKSSFEENKEKLFPPAEKQRTIAEEKRDKDLGAVRSELSHKIREEIIQKALEGGKSMRAFVNELVRIDGELLKQYNYDVIMEPIVKSLREEGYWVESGTTSVGGCFRYGYHVSWN